MMNMRNGMGPHGRGGRHGQAAGGRGPCGRGQGFGMGPVQGRGMGRGFGRGMGNGAGFADPVSSGCVERIKARIAHLQARLAQLCGTTADSSQ